MRHHDPQLGWIDSQHERMCGLVSRWASINSGSHNMAGLARLSDELKREFNVLGGEMIELPLAPMRSINSAGEWENNPIAPAISIRKRPSARIRIFLCIHADTVYGVNHPFQRCELTEPNILRGPGVADAKGGLAVMLISLEALEQSPLSDQIGWEVLINTDEEIGSPGSAATLASCAKRNHIGLVYEPALADGSLVGARKGSGNFAIVVRGKSAHAGRDFHLGRNAMHAAAELVVKLNAINGSIPAVTLNVSRIDGGGPENVVPNLAIIRFNIRVPTPADQIRVEAELNRIITTCDLQDGITVQLSGGITSPPKPLEDRTLDLFHAVADCGQDLGLSLTWKPGGGVCDGNKLAAAGLPVVDTLGPRGGNLHSAEEFVFLDSLVERAKLSALLMMKIATQEIRMTKFE